MEKKNIYSLHEEHKTWLNVLQFYKDDIEVMKKRLEEIASKNTSKEVLAMVEHFQNQLIIQRNNIDELNHAVKQEENAIEKNINNNPVAVDHRSMEDNPKMRDDINSFEKNFAELRKDFIGFIAKWM